MRRWSVIALLVMTAGCAGEATEPASSPTVTTSTTVADATTTAGTPTSASTTTTTSSSVPAAVTTVTTTVPSAPDDRTAVILDTDANNELDDQHAIAYLLAADDVFDVRGLTINRTSNGGALDLHVAEAERIVTLMGATVPVIAGASGSFDEITADPAGTDGQPAVDFIVDTVRSTPDREVVLLPIGKLTNIALALHEAPDIADRVRILWLGSNYPAPGEYNQDNDETALNYLLDLDVPFEIALVRAATDDGTAAVAVTLDEIRRRMPGVGPSSPSPVPGRDGGEFATFGDYSVDLFERALGGRGDAARALYDLAAVAIAIEPGWAMAAEIPAPTLVDGAWIDRPDNERTILLWSQFDRDAIIADLYARLAAEG